MTKYYYPAVFEPALEGGFVVYLPDFDGSVTEGDDLEEATKMVKSLIFCCLDGLDEKDYPRPSKISDIDVSDYVSEYKPQDKEVFVNIIEYDPNDFSSQKTHNDNADYTAEHYSDGQVALSL